MIRQSYCTEEEEETEEEEITDEINKTSPDSEDKDKDEERLEFCFTGCLILYYS